MKQFFNVLGFELSGYFKNKAYSITTIILSLFLIVGLSLPSLFDMSNIIPSLKNDTNVESLDEVSGEDKTKFVIVDNNNILGNLDVAETAFPNSKWTKVESSDEAEKMVKSEKAEAAFILNSLNKYSYVVDNLGLYLLVFFRQLIQSEEGTHKMLLPVSNITLNFEGGEPIYISPMY